MPNIFFSESHDWVRIDDDGLATTGITAQALRGVTEIVSLTLPEPGRSVAKNEACGIFNLASGATDLSAPLSGTVIETNAAAADKPGDILAAPQTTWLFKLRLADPTAFAELMDQAAYDAFLARG